MLRRYPALNTNDFELSRYIHKFRQLSLEPVDVKSTRGPFHTLANSFENPNFLLYYFSYSDHVILDAIAENPDYWLAVPIKVHKANSQGRLIELKNGSARLASPGSPDPLRLKAGSESLGLCLKQHTVRKYAETYFGEHFNKPVVFDHHFDISNTVDRTIGQLLAMIIEEDHINASVLADERCINHFIDSVVSTLLLHAPHSHSALLEEKNYAPAPRDVKRVIDYIKTSPNQAIALADLIRIADVSGRSLNEHFRIHTGLSPMAYVKIERLKSARRQLLSGASQNIAQIAMENGFFHLGRFSNSYKQKFGELPSASLARGLKKH